ncbi:hypothetical protein V6N12_025589 [Hibiscus sabdariffa]|uniref:Uncharacterized protein n=1 Tax=Hibiscus sabdariffa TaxID=183260 RepID=A0ABR2CL44_9ROSI
MEEDLDHILRRCPPTPSLWSSLVKTEGWTEFLSLPMKDWLFANIVSPIKFVSDTLYWLLLFPYILWNIWKRRNDKVFGGESERRESVYVQSVHMVEMGVLRGTSVHLANNNSQQDVGRDLVWCRPPIGWCKLNTDGSVDKTTNFALCGGVI